MWLRVPDQNSRSDCLVAFMAFLKLDQTTLVDEHHEDELNHVVARENLSVSLGDLTSSINLQVIV